MMSSLRFQRALAAGSAIALVVLSLWCVQSLAWRSEPRFFRMDRRIAQATVQQPVLRFQADSERRKHSLYLLSDDDGQPLLFYTDVTLIVCCDRVCDPVRIELYWDLVGNYAGYGVAPNFPLLKYDHEPFDAADYAKLHQILLDRDSPLGGRPLTELYYAPPAQTTKSTTSGKQQLDAISGATSHEIRQAVVRGALYSCYAIWHLVHGELRQRMLDHLRTLHSPALAQRFLNSPNADYQQYAIAQMNVTSLEKNLPRILELYAKSNATLRTSILENLPKQAWAKENTASILYGSFSKADTKVKTALLRNLGHAHAQAATLLADQVESMTKTHLKAYLQFFADNPRQLTEEIRSKLQRLAETERYAYCYVIAAFLEKQR